MRRSIRIAENSLYVTIYLNAQQDQQRKAERKQRKASRSSGVWYIARFEVISVTSIVFNNNIGGYAN